MSLNLVELTLKNGKRIRIGTDEPIALIEAIEKMIGKPEPLTHPEIEQGKRYKRKSLILRP